MHDIEPYYNWRDEYRAEEDEKSPFFGRVYSEFYFKNKIYNFYIHPQWDEFGSQTLYLKILYTNYEEGYTILELIGEWNDCLYNDIMILKRNIIDSMVANGITRFILIGENVLNFHPSDDCYYEEWYEEVKEAGGWIAMVNFREHVLSEFSGKGMGSFVEINGELNDLDFRTMHPVHLYMHIEGLWMNRLYY